jgi:MerR family transcriptional regulator, light-induced transcriptional regulator
LPNTPPATYRIGALAKSTGLPVTTLRAWEMRYQAFSPLKTEGGHRLYQEHDLHKAMLLKQLSERGSAISSIAARPLTELRALLAPLVDPVWRQAVAVLQSRPTAPEQRLLVVGEGMQLRMSSLALKRALTACNMTVQIAPTGLHEALTSQAFDQCHVLLIKVSSLSKAGLHQLDKFMAQHSPPKVILLYSYSRGAALDALKARGLHVQRDPLSDEQLADALLKVAARPLPASNPTVTSPSAHPRSATHPNPPPSDPWNAIIPSPRKYSEETLQNVAARSTNILCECPKHVAELISQLSHFEDYSRDCLSVSNLDADLHHYLQKVSGVARTLFEQALERVSQHEGLELLAS